MPTLTSDSKLPNLYVDPRTGIFYFRKYLTGAGEICRSLKTTNRYKAVIKMNQLLREVEKYKAKGARRLIDDVILELTEQYQMKAEATYNDFHYYARTYIAPYFVGSDIKEVAKQWPAFKTFMKRQHPTVNLARTRKHLVRILNHSVECEYLDSFPKLKLDAADKRHKPDPEVYDDTSLDAALNQMPEGFKDRTLQKMRLFIKFTLFYGLRPPQEIRHLKYEFFDFEKCLVHLPAEIVKTREPRTVELDPDMIAEVKAWRASSRRVRSEYLFPKRGRPDLPMTRTDKTWQRLKRALGIKGKLYWFRHTHATLRVEQGEAPLVVKKDMGTSFQMLERVYVRRRAGAKKSTGLRYRAFGKLQETEEEAIGK